MKKRKSVLITAIGSSNGRAIANILHDRFPELNLLVCDCNDLTLLTQLPYVQETFRVPLAKSDNYVEVINEYCLKYHIEFIIPVHDDEVIKLSEVQERFSKYGIAMFLSSNNTLETCRDKFLFFEALKKHDLPAIESSLHPFENYPQFIKPRSGNGSLGCFKINNEEEAKVFSNRVSNGMFQKYIEGDVLDVDFISNSEYVVQCAVIKKEIQTKNGIGVKIEIMKNEDLLKLLQDIVQALNYVGIGAVEFFHNEDGFYIIELNIRPSSGIIFSYKAGIDMMGHFFKSADFLEVEIQDKPIKYGQRFNRELVAFEL